MLIKLIIFRGFLTLKLRFWAVFKPEMTLSLLHIVSNTSKCTFLPQSPKTCRRPNFQLFTSVTGLRLLLGNRLEVLSPYMVHFIIKVIKNHLEKLPFFLYFFETENLLNKNVRLAKFNCLWRP